MLSWVVTFLVVALIAGILGFGGIAGASIEIAKAIFFIAVILFLVSAVVGLVRGRTQRLTPIRALFRGHRHFPADALGARHGGMRIHHRLDAGANVGRKRRDLSRLHVHMERHVFRGGGEPAFGGVAQFLERVQPLLIGDLTDKPKSERDRRGESRADSEHGIRR